MNFAHCNEIDAFYLSFRPQIVVRPMAVERNWRIGGYEIAMLDSYSPGA
jgi:hypothetical protein